MIRVQRKYKLVKANSIRELQEIVNELIRNVIFDKQKQNKLIFDGYPRSITQADLNFSRIVNQSQTKDFSQSH